MALASESKFLIQKFIQKPFYLNSLTPSAPFRLFKSLILPKELSKNKVCLPLNRFTDPIALSASSSHISLWSQSHLQFIKLLNRNKSLNLNKLILKNPFKTEKLIQDCIELGLKTMVVDSFEQLFKIHQCRCLNKTSDLQLIPLNFIWSVSDPQNDLKQIDTLKSYNIKLGGLLFDGSQTSKISEVKKFIEKVNHGLSEKKKIRTVYLESDSDSFDLTRQLYQKDEFFIKNRIETILEKTNFTMTDKYWIAARVIGQNRRRQPILNNEAYNYVSNEQAKRGELWEQDGKKWIISTISHFPETETMEEHERKGYIMNMN